MGSGGSVPKTEQERFRLIFHLDPTKPDRYSDYKRYDKFREMPEVFYPVWHIAVAEARRVLAAAVADHSVQLWDLPAKGRPELRVALHAHTAHVWAVVFSPNESALVTGSHDNTIRMWETLTGKPISCCKGHFDGIRCLAFSDTGWLVSGGFDSNLCLWEYDNSTFTKKWKAHEGSVHGISFTGPDPNLALSVGADGSIAAWNVPDGEDGFLGRFAAGDGGGVLCVNAHPTRPGVVACGNEDGGVWLWFYHHSPGQAAGQDTGGADGTVTGHNKLMGHKEAVWSVDFTHDGCFLVSGSSDSHIRVWNVIDLKSPTMHSIFKAYEWGWVRRACWIFGRSCLATCSTDGTVSIWQAPKGVRDLKAPEETELRGHFDAELGEPVCRRGHELRVDPRPRHLCDMCFDRGTHYVCARGCDYDICRRCYKEVYLTHAGTSMEFTGGFGSEESPPGGTQVSFTSQVSATGSTPRTLRELYHQSQQSQQQQQRGLPAPPDRTPPGQAPGSTVFSGAGGGLAATASEFGYPPQQPQMAVSPQVTSTLTNASSPAKAGRPSMLPSLLPMTAVPPVKAPRQPDFTGQFNIPPPPPPPPPPKRPPW
mmetsp:Transcript_65303/g.183886  ORF Transcript_65303/g.183886 Transcript_65303/m.183886 type:complete len:594 (-) Transcript_65303:56-1837(-)